METLIEQPTPKAFGKFKPSSPLAIRVFEEYLGIESRGAWKSKILCIQRLLDHLRRYTQSDSSREKYLRHVAQFCHWINLSPDELIRLPKGKIEGLVQSFADELATKGRSKAYVNSVIKRLKTFFRANGYVGNRELKVRGYFVPARYRVVAEYIPTKSEIDAMANASGNRRDRAIILTMWSSGLRVSTLCALNYGDIADELEKGEPHIMISVYPEMKSRVLDACKGLITYYAFICLEAGEALRSYLRDREEKYGAIRLSDPLFYSDWTL